MKAKRLTALALAALMAVSTTSVALAGERVDYDLDVVTSPVQYYKYDSDAGMLVKVDNDDFQPGDDVYILLEENGSPLTSKTTYNAYGTWQIGDSWVKDIDLVYRKEMCIRDRPCVPVYTAAWWNHTGGPGAVPAPYRDSRFR